MQRRERVGGQHGVAVAEPQLRQPRAFAHQHREGARADLRIKRAPIAGVDAVEAAGAVGDHPGEHVEPPGRAFRIGGGGDLGRQGETFQQRHDIDAAGLQHGAGVKRDCVQFQFVDALADRRFRSGQETRPHPVGDRTQAQVDAGRLNLVGVERDRRDDGAARNQRGNHAVGQDAFVDMKAWRHVRVPVDRAVARSPDERSDIRGPQSRMSLRSSGLQFCEFDRSHFTRSPP